VDGDGDYVIVVKDNQHRLLDDVMTTFHGPFSSMLEKSHDTTVDSGHGRIEKRCLTASSAVSQPVMSCRITWIGLVWSRCLWWNAQPQ
jgi:hypothetical protein